MHLTLELEDADMASLGGIYFWTQHDYNNLLQSLADIQHRLATIQALQVQSQASLKTIQTQESKIMPALDDLQAQVAQNTNLEQSAVTLIQGIAKQLADAVENNDSAALTALAGQLNTSAAALGAAISANTPAAAPVDPNAPQINPLSGTHRR